MKQGGNFFSHFSGGRAKRGGVNWHFIPFLVGGKSMLAAMQGRNQEFFGAGSRHKKEGLRREKIFFFFSNIFTKLHFKWEFNPYMHINRVIFSKIRVLFPYFKKRLVKPPTLPLSSCTPKLIYFLLFFLHDNVKTQQKFTFDFKKPSFTWLAAAILV